jgi:hypothetical protein
MSPQENRLLQDFLDQLTQVRGIVKDPQADALIARAVSQQADAPYLLVQRALLQDQALDAAKAQIASLQNQLQAMQPAQHSAAGRFLDDANSWGNSAGSGQRVANYTAAPSAAQYDARPTQAPAAAAAPRFLGGGAGSFLGSMAATAAGVAGGAFLYQGLQNLMGHSGGADVPEQHGAASLPPENARTDDAASDPASDNSDLAADAGFDDIGGDDSV